MTITNTDICNMALSHIAVGGIISMDESSEAAKQCKIHYEHTRRRLLGMYNWNFAARETKLALLDETVPGFDFAYAYPEECLKIYYVYEEGEAPYKEEHPRDYKVVAATGVRRAVATDVEKAWCSYTADIKDPDMMSEEFITGFSHLLASDLSMALTGNASLMQTNLQLAQMSVAQAKWESVVEAQRRTRYPDGYARARF